MHKIKLIMTGRNFAIFAISLFTSWPGMAEHPPATSHIVGIAHFAYYVSNLRRARAYYQGFLGFDQAFTVKSTHGNVRAAYFKINRWQYIILYPLRQGQREHYGWMHDAGFRSDNIAASHAFVRHLGMPGLTPIGRDPAGDREFSFLDPSGFTLEVIQYSPHSLTAQTAGHFDSPRRIGLWIDHIGLLQKSRRQAARFYQAFLASPRKVRGHKLTIADGPARFEIGWQRKKPTPIRFHIKDHICLRVNHVLATVARLNTLPRARRYRTIETHQLSNGKYVAELYDPDGNRVELMEPPQTATHPVPAAMDAQGYEILTRLPPGHHALLERMTQALGLSYQQELQIEPRLHAEEAVSQPLLRFSAFTPRQKKTVMLELKIAARRNLLPLLTLRQRRLLRHDMQVLARTGKEPLGHRRHHGRSRHRRLQHHPGKPHARNHHKKKLMFLPLAQSEPTLSRAIRHYLAFTPQQKHILLLQVKQAALQHAGALPLRLRRKLRRQVQQLQTRR